MAPDSTSGQLIDNTSSIDERIRREVPTVRLSGEYALNDRQSFTSSASWADRGGLRTYTELNDGSTPSGVITSSSRRLSSGHDPETDLDEKLGSPRSSAVSRRDAGPLSASIHLASVRTL